MLNVDNISSWRFQTYIPRFFSNPAKILLYPPSVVVNSETLHHPSFFVYMHTVFQRNIFTSLMIYYLSIYIFFF